MALLLASVTLILSASAIQSSSSSTTITPKKQSNDVTHWERVRDYWRQNIWTVDSNQGIVHLHPLNIHVKYLRRAPGPHFHHNVYLRDYYYRQNQQQNNQLEEEEEEEAPSSFHNNLNRSATTFKTCAPWIPKHQRRIHTTFMDHWWLGNCWTRYQEGRGHLGGEMYWVAGLDYILQHMGFEMVSALDLTAIQALQANTSVAYIQEGGFSPSPLAKQRLKSSVATHNYESVGCRTHTLEWWNKASLEGAEFYYGNRSKQQKQQHHRNRSLWLDKRRFIYPFKDPNLIVNSQEALSIPFLVHGQVIAPFPTEAEKARERKGFLLSKNCHFSPAILRTLLDAGFELHTTCLNGYPPPNNNGEQEPHREEWMRQHQPNLVHHGKLKPTELARVLRSMAFVLGFGFPTDSPTPYEGLYNGAAFLNPVYNLTLEGRPIYNDSFVRDPYRDTQHIPLRSLGPPHVYNYEAKLYDVEETAQQVLKHAELAVRNRFVSYVPPEHRLENVMDTICRDLIEYNYQNCGGTRTTRSSSGSPSSAAAIHESNRGHGLGIASRIFNRILGTLIRGYYLVAQELMDIGFIT